MEGNGKGSFVHQYYKPTEIICGRQMKEWLPFSVSWWHNLGSQSMKGQFKHTSGILYEAEKAELAFEMMKRLDIEYFCLQGAGGCGPAENLLQTEEQQKQLNAIIEEKMNKYNSKLLWGAGNYINLEQTELGAGTSPSLDVFLQSLALEKINVDTVLQLNGTGIMFWGGKEGYQCMADTNLRLELDNRAEYIRKTIEYARKKGFKGQFYLEPKPKRPGRFQYHFDVAAAVLYLKEHDLDKEVKLCLDSYHAALAGHEFDYEFRMAKLFQTVGTIDISPDRFLDTALSEIEQVKRWVLVMYDLIELGGLSGGINFDPKDYREKYTEEFVVKALFCGQETLSWAFRAAAWLWENGKLEHLRSVRYEEISKKEANYNMEEVWERMKGKHVKLERRFYTEEKVNLLLEKAVKAVYIAD